MKQTITVKEWCRRYLKEREGKWSAVTKNSYSYFLERYMTPVIGEIELTGLTSRMIQNFYKTLAVNGLGEQSILCVHLLLRRFLDEACREGLLLANPAKDFKLPQHEEERHAPLRLGQFQRYLNAAETQGVLPLIYVGLTSGLRQKELLTLKWSDFIDQKQIYKNKRLLVLNQKAALLLRDEYTHHPDSREVFLNPKTGQPYRPHEFYYLHQKLLKSARLPQISFRELAKSCKGVAR